MQVDNPIHYPGMGGWGIIGAHVGFCPRTPSNLMPVLVLGLKVKLNLYLDRRQSLLLWAHSTSAAAWRQHQVLQTCHRCALQHLAKREHQCWCHSNQCYIPAWWLQLADASAALASCKASQGGGSGKEQNWAGERWSWSGTGSGNKPCDPNDPILQVVNAAQSQPQKIYLLLNTTMNM